IRQYINKFKKKNSFSNSSLIIIILVSFQTRIERLTHQLNEALAELEVYRREGVLARSSSAKEISKEPKPMVRSHSATNLVDDVADKQEVQIWKEKCGTMFRELNAMRSGYQRAQADRRDLKIQVAMLRGELEMARCQSERDADTSVGSSSVYFSPVTTRSRSYHTPSELRRRQNVVVHESPRPFERGSTRESVACRISATPSRKLQPPDQERRSRSEQRKRSTSTKLDHEARERRRSARKNIPSSLSSSVTSMNDGKPLENGGQQMMRSVPLMSQSWHETTEQRVEFVVPQRTESQTNVVRRESRAISLRERVGQLTRENRSLQDQLALANAALASARKARVDNDRLNKLEQEKDALREKVELLLAKIEQVVRQLCASNVAQLNILLQDSTSACAALADANARLELCRNENMMYENKIREMEEERREMYLVMFKKGQEAAAMDLKEVAQVDQMTQDRVVLRFLHDAFYYYLLNKGDAKEHLQAIMTMLNFSVEQKDEVARKRSRAF
ncbi:hypothetical protein OESDEN_06381, partial [Oesophagostomum dentatum]